ncbi:MAG TPA: MFS transporter [Caulobacteraceae bacterium]
MNPAAPFYIRARRREGPVPLTVKVVQGIGAMPEVFKNFAFNTFLLLYYSQVRGLPAGEVGLVIGAALILDAAADPLIGAFSDTLRSRLGRRHPLMLAAALPMAAGLFATFAAPALAPGGLLAWCFATVVATHLATSFFVLPWSALFAEFSDDYAERTSIVTWRFAWGGLGGVAFGFACWTFVFRSSQAFPKGQLDPAAYLRFAPVVAIAVLASILAATLGTRGEIPYLLQPASRAPRFHPAAFAAQLAAVLRNRDFLVIFLGLLTSSAIAGSQASLDIYLQSWFWGLGPHELRWLSIALLGAVVGFAVAGRLQARFEKKTLMLGSFLLLLADGMGVVALRLLSVMPANGDPALLPILVVNELARALLTTVLLIMLVSMIADTLDSQELASGLRQEGLFSAALSFSAKATTGLGALISGLILEHVVGWPQGAVAASHVTPRLLIRLGVVDGLLLPALYLVPFAVCLPYSIGRGRHGEIRAALEARRAAAAASGPALDLPADLRAEMEV